MKMRFVFPTSVAVIAVSFVFWQMHTGNASAAPGDLASAASAATCAMLTLGEQAEFVGSNKCKKCHLAEHKDWEKLRHGTAFETLKPGKAAEAKTKFKLDPQKDYTKDAACLACHTVGFGKPGGYQIPADEEAAKKMKPFEGAGCESCHGAGGGYMDLHEEIMKSKRKYKAEEMYAKGVVKPEAAVCLTCHNDKSPTHDASTPFNYEEMKKKGVHAHVELKQRE